MEIPWVESRNIMLMLTDSILCVLFAGLLLRGYKKLKTENSNEIFPRIAMYRALKIELPDSAMEIMDSAVKKAGTKVGNTIGALTKIPGMPKVFVRIMAYMLKKMFGPEAGFTQQYYQTDKNELKFDVTVCPYCKYCELCDCTELTHTFCDSDVYCYGNLPGVLFERTQTLGTGGSCCDFHFKVERRK